MVTGQPFQPELRCKPQLLWVDTRHAFNRAQFCRHSSVEKAGKLSNRLPAVFDLDDGAASGIYNLLKSAEHAHRG
jgi:hypothetical protein